MLKTLHRSRLARLARLLGRERIDAAFICPSPDFHYLTGAMLPMRARPIFLVVTPRSAALFTPLLEAESSAREVPGLPVWTWEDGQDGMRVARERLPRARRIAVSRTFRADWVLALQAARPAVRVVSAAPAMDELRMTKDAPEIRALRESALLADKIMGEARARLKPGVRECEVAEFVLRRFVARGAVNPWIACASGPNGALPHHHFDDRKLRRGDVIVVDLGAELRDYQSDITRTFFLGRPEPEAERVYQVVHAAQAAGRARVKAGTPGRDADDAARKVISRAGYGKYFIHRLGHGLGLEVHELPHLNNANFDPLPMDSVVTVEPGIYLPGRFGIRLEDVVVARRAGPRTLTTFPLDRQLLK